MLSQGVGGGLKSFFKKILSCGRFETSCKTFVRQLKGKCRSHFYTRDTYCPYILISSNGYIPSHLNLSCLFMIPSAEYVILHVLLNTCSVCFLSIGVFAAAHDLKTEWTVTKGILRLWCDVANDWLEFANATVASVVNKILSEPYVLIFLQIGQITLTAVATIKKVQSWGNRIRG